MWVNRLIRKMGRGRRGGDSETGPARDKVPRQQGKQKLTFRKPSRSFKDGRNNCVMSVFNEIVMVSVDLQRDRVQTLLGECTQAHPREV